MHGLLVDRFSDVTGMDIDEKTVAEMNVAGFRAVVGNANISTWDNSSIPFLGERSSNTSGT